MLPVALPLMPCRQERAAVLARAISLLQDHWDAGPNIPIGPSLVPDAIEAALSGLSFDAPAPLSDVLERAFELFSLGMVNVAHPRNFGLFIPSPSFAGVLGDFIASGLNPQLAVCNHAPAAVAAERRVIEALGDQFGLPATHGPSRSATDHNWRPRRGPPA